MLTEPVAMRGSFCPICKSQMYVNGPDEEILLGCTNDDCDFNDKEAREAYFRYKHRSIIAGEMMRNVQREPRVGTTIRKPRFSRE